MTTDEFIRSFRIVPTSLFGLPRDLSNAGPDDPLEGDCQTYARTVRNTMKVKPWEAVVWRCWSKPGLPRHAVIWVKGNGFIDSTTRKWRKTPLPCIPAWPVGLPVAVGLLGLFGLAGPIYADPQCLALPQFIDGLASRYAETPRMSGLAGNHLLVITASDAGTWTALMVNPDGTACMVSAGEAFVIAPVAVPGVLN